MYGDDSSRVSYVADRSVNEPVNQSNNQIYVCVYCRNPCLTLSSILTVLPQRKTDRAYIIQPNNQSNDQSINQSNHLLIKQSVIQTVDIIENTLIPDKPVYLSRNQSNNQSKNQGVEVQYRYKCPGCALFVAYQSIPFEQSTNQAKPILYVLDDALTLESNDENQSNNQSNNQRRYQRRPVSSNPEIEAMNLEIDRMIDQVIDQNRRKQAK